MRRGNKLAILHKIEPTPGTEAVPTGADAIIGKNWTFTPLGAERVSRDLVMPHLGNQGVMLAGTYGRLEMDVELAGSGSLGLAPKWGSLLRVCGFAETVTAETDVVYTLVEDGAETGSIYFVLDGVRHVLLGGRATGVVTMATKTIPTIRITYTGLLGTITDVGAMPAVTTTGWQKPVMISAAATQMELHGWAAIAESLTIDIGNTITPRHLIGAEYIAITSRASTGTAVVEAQALATVNWFEKARSRGRGALSIVHGASPGNVVEIAAPAVEIGEPSQGNTAGILTYSLALDLCPVDGLDEIRIIVR